MTYSVKQICELYEVNEHTVLAWIHSGELEAINVGVEPGKKKPRWRILHEARLKFERKRTKATPTAPVASTPKKKKPEGYVEYFPVTKRRAAK